MGLPGRALEVCELVPLARSFWVVITITGGRLVESRVEDLCVRVTSRVVGLCDRGSWVTAYVRVVVLGVGVVEVVVTYPRGVVETGCCC